jgi:protocatechuate 3,4-dioxygenase beta subunit
MARPVAAGRLWCGVQMTTDHGNPTRRRFLITTMVAGGAAFAGGDIHGAGAQELAPTPECRDGDEPTLRQTEGPFFKPRSPERSDLVEAGLSGRPIELAGLVLTRSCRPVAGALVDLWHADGKGGYDNDGFRCRGHQFTDASGRYRFRTVLPAVYSGRTRHFHVKVQAARQPVLTTQLYFPGEPANRRDRLFRQELLMRMAAAGAVAHFDFVLDLA